MKSNLDALTTNLNTCTCGNKCKDNINHPSHYGRDNAIECIDEMIMIFGKQAVMDFCKCNAWKYRYRAADKNGAEDIAKSDWYMRKYKELAATPSTKYSDPWS